MHRLALLVLSIVVAFTAVVGGIVITNRRSLPVESAPGVSAADLAVKEASIREESGKVRWHLTAKQALVFEREGRTSLRDVVVDVQEPERSWIIRGEEGDLFHGQNDLEIRGNVILTSSDGLRLETTVLRWRNAERRVWTDVPVKITLPGGIITGSALDVQVAEETTTVSGRVRATFDRRPADRRSAS
jgi:LPS export ABC transporter protein LptC